jgi:hypothetical protein
MLDYNIICPLAPSISPMLYGWTSRGGIIKLTHVITLDGFDGVTNVVGAARGAVEVGEAADEGATRGWAV